MGSNKHRCIVIREPLELSKKELELVEEMMKEGKYDKYIDKRGSEEHRRLIYETILYFKRRGYDVAPRKFKGDADVALRKGNEILLVECGQTRREIPRLDFKLVHVSYSRDITFLNDEVLEIYCYKDYIYKVEKTVVWFKNNYGAVFEKPLP